MQKPHPNFTRHADDLHTSITLDLKEALTGWRRQVATIDGKQLPLSGSGPTQPGYEEKFPGLGMPRSKKVGERGDLVVRVNVKFPPSLTMDQKRILRDTL